MRLPSVQSSQFEKTHRCICSGAAEVRLYAVFLPFELTMYLSFENYASSRKATPLYDLLIITLLFRETYYFAKYIIPDD